MKYKWRVLYKVPIEEITDDPDTWRRTWYFSIYDCPEKLDFEVKILNLIRDFKLKKDYIIIQTLNEDGEVKNEYNYIDN